MNVSLIDRKLFEEIDERWQREDEWSFPKSVSIGWPLDGELKAEDFRRFSIQYFKASQSVCEMVHGNKIEDFVASYPIIYLFRHSVELALKAAVLHQTGSSEGGHDLSTLVGKCSIPDDHISPRRSALFMARSVLRELRDGGRPC